MQGFQAHMTDDSHNSDRSGLNARPAPEQPRPAPSLQSGRIRGIVNEQIDALLLDMAGLDDLPEPETAMETQVRDIVREQIDAALDQPMTPRGIVTGLRYVNGDTDLDADDLRALMGFPPRDSE